MDEILVKRVLNNKGSRRDARRVAEWLSTEEGQIWLAANMDKEEALIEEHSTDDAKSLDSKAVLVRINNSIRQREIRRKIAIAAALILPVLAISIVWADLSSRTGGEFLKARPVSELMTRKGQQKDVVFQDGTVITLNGNSKLTYPTAFGLRQRKVKLDGEAVFNVARDEKKPFVVLLDGGRSIIVTGTKFNVEAYDNSDDINVVLIKGKIAFSDGNRKYDMKPSQELHYSKSLGKATVLTNDRALEKALWAEGILSFRDTPLRDVLEKLKHQFDCDFSISDKRTLDYTFSMKSEKGASLEAILEDMQSISPIRIKKNEDGSYVVGIAE